MSEVLARYEALVAASELRPDPLQQGAACRLDALAVALETDAPRPGLFGRLFGKPAQAPRGVYLWGGVGRGKTMLMDLFFNALAIAAKRRVHFQEFMEEVNARLHAEAQRGTPNPVPVVGKAMADGLRLLAFDELVIDKGGDAHIISRLFEAMIAEGLAIVATSNRPPRDLYKNGLNREVLFPFFDLLEAKMDVFALDGPTDYRLQRLGRMEAWMVPANDAATATLRAAFYRLTDYPPEDSAHVPSTDIDVPGGRTLHVPKCLKGVAVFSFKKLCGGNHWTPEFLAIARRFHTVFLVGIPQMGPDQRNEAARFRELIDALYDRRRILIASAAVEPEQLFTSGDGAFEFERTVSRLQEMRSEDWLTQARAE